MEMWLFCVKSSHVSSSRSFLVVCSSKEESSDYYLRRVCLAAIVSGVRQGKIGWGGGFQLFSILVV